VLLPEFNAYNATGAAATACRGVSVTNPALLVQSSPVSGRTCTSTNRF
jgi:hypothetical protein